MFIDRIYHINHTETWNFNAPTLVTSVSHKITAKCGILCPKTLLLTQKQLHAIHFFVATRNVCPQRSQSLGESLFVWISYNLILVLKSKNSWLCDFLFTVLQTLHYPPPDPALGGMKRKSFTDSYVSFVSIPSSLRARYKFQWIEIVRFIGNRVRRPMNMFKRWCILFLESSKTSFNVENSHVQHSKRWLHAPLYL